MKLVKISLTTQMFVGLILGVIIGIIFNNIPYSEDIFYFFKQLGDVFINLIKLMILPVVFFTLTASITNFHKGEKLSFLLFKTFCLYITTSIIAITIGLIVAHIFLPEFELEIQLPELTKEIAKPNSIMSVLF